MVDYEAHEANCTATEAVNMAQSLDSNLKQAVDRMQVYDVQIAELYDFVHRNDLPKPIKAEGDPWGMPKSVIRPKQRATKDRPRPRRMTVIKWRDGTVTHAAPYGGTPFDPYVGIVICCAKRIYALCESKGWTVEPFAWCVRERGKCDAFAGSPRHPSDEAYLRDVMNYAESLYARLMKEKHLGGSYQWPRNGSENQAATFADFVQNVAAYEVDELADRISDDFEKRLRKMREGGLAWAIRHKHERYDYDYDCQVQKKIKTAEQNGANHFEAWVWATDRTSKKICDDPTPGIKEAECEEIRRLAPGEARAQIEALSEIRVLITGNPEAPYPVDTDGHWA